MAHNNRSDEEMIDHLNMIHVFDISERFKDLKNEIKSLKYKLTRCTKKKQVLLKQQKDKPNEL